MYHVYAYIVNFLKYNLIVILIFFNDKIFLRFFIFFQLKFNF